MGGPKAEETVGKKMSENPGEILKKWILIKLWIRDPLVRTRDLPKGKTKESQPGDQREVSAQRKGTAQPQSINDREWAIFPKDLRHQNPWVQSGPTSKCAPSCRISPEVSF